jgi:hypothetical protein
VVVASATEQMRGDTASGPCAGGNAAQALDVHLAPALLMDASWADFQVPPSATHVVLCADGQAMSYRILERHADSLRMRIGNRFVLQHFLLQDLDVYAQPERWTVLFEESS